jgi:hypothetical protein
MHVVNKNRPSASKAEKHAPGKKSNRTIAAVKVNVLVGIEIRGNGAHTTTRIEKERVGGRVVTGRDWRATLSARDGRRNSEIECGIPEKFDSIAGQKAIYLQKASLLAPAHAWLATWPCVP